MTEEAPPAAKTAFLKRSVSFGAFCEVIAVLALTFTWLGSLGRYHWALDLVSHFRLQYLVAGMGVAFFALFRRRTWLVLAALISMLWNAQIIHAVHHTAGPVVSAGKPLRLMIFNVLFNNKTPVAAIDHVLQVDADIVCLLEVDRSWQHSLEPLRVKYPQRVEDLSAGAFGIACYTRLPVKSSEVRRFTIWGLPTVLLNLDHLGTPLTFIGTHPHAPMGALPAQQWRSQLSEIGATVAAIAGEVIVAGDFNATPWCEGMRLLREAGGLQFRSVAPVWPPTWSLNLPMMIPIDHVLLKGSLSVQKRVLGPEVGSDHRSVTVELARAGGL